MTKYELPIQALLMSDCLSDKQHKASVTNAQYLLLGGESDLVSVTRAGLVHEFEIKCSKGDYNREFKSKTWKHSCLQRGDRRGPNYFWFVTLDFEIEPPVYAGWVLVTSTNNGFGRPLVLREQKPAPRLHIGKWDDSKIAQMARLLSFRLLKQYNGSLQASS